jgi:hypothetical protein
MTPLASPIGPVSRQYPFTSSSIDVVTSKSRIRAEYRGGPTNRNRARKGTRASYVVPAFEPEPVVGKPQAVIT